MLRTLTLLLLLNLTACGACYREDKNADGSWPSYCSDRFDTPKPK